MAGSHSRLSLSAPPPVPFPSRKPALVIASSSLLLSSGLATCLYVWRSTLDRVDSDTDGVEQDGAAVAAWWTGEAALRWSLLSAGGSVFGVLGLLLRDSRLHRVFAITTAVDLLATVLLALVLSLLTFTPALAPTFSTFLCSSTFISDFSASRSHEGLTWSDGVELVLWGVETCEESWRTGMIRVIFGCAVATALRLYGVLISWEANSEMRDQELRDRGEGWVDQEMCEIEAATVQQGDRKSARQLEETLGRPRSSSPPSTSSRRSGMRSSTLPLYSDFSDSPHHVGGKRTRSHTFASGTGSRRQQPQLVLVPVVLDQHGHPVYSPSSPSFTLPPYASPSRSRSSTYHEAFSPSPIASSSASRSSSRASKRAPRPRSSSSSSSASRLFNSQPIVDSPPLMALTDEPLDIASVPLSPPLTPVASCTGKKEDDRASRRARSKSENDASQSSFPDA
ncbi:hypothetical protein JCM11251_001175 [Rhodosporidiobolus azoricus]